jgi:hypothetical protein
MVYKMASREFQLKEGVTQGSFLYSLATFPLVKTIQESLRENSGKFTKFFVDDGSISGNI